MPETAKPEIFLEDITINAKGVLEISQIKYGANSYDQITPSLLKASAPYVVATLLTLANFPKSGKTYTCVFITKNGSKTENKNYRPIAMFCAITKIFETPVYKQIKRSSKGSFDLRNMVFGKSIQQ